MLVLTGAREKETIYSRGFVTWYYTKWVNCISKRADGDYLGKQSAYLTFFLGISVLVLDHSACGPWYCIPHSSIAY